MSETFEDTPRKWMEGAEFRPPIEARLGFTYAGEDFDGCPLWEKGGRNFRSAEFRPSKPLFGRYHLGDDFLIGIPAARKEVILRYMVYPHAASSHTIQAIKDAEPGGSSAIPHAKEVQLLALCRAGIAKEERIARARAQW